MRILFLSISLGSGHLMTARAVAEYLEILYPGTECIVADVLDYMNPFAGRLITGGYFGAIRHSPGIYRAIYDISGSDARIAGYIGGANEMLSRGVKTLLNECNPSAVVCTQPFPLQMVSGMKRKGQTDVPLMVVMTDYAFHPMWAQRHVDAYAVAHEGLKKRIVVQGGARDDTVHVTGIPVLKRFLEKGRRCEIRRKLGLDGRPVVLLMGGSLGFGSLAEALDILVGSRMDIQVIAVAGTNKDLEERLRRISEKSEKAAGTVRVFGYRNDIQEFMDAADLIITKPGGMTITEALVKALPLFIITPIPGHEEGNAAFLASRGAAVNIMKLKHMDELLKHYIETPGLLTELKSNAGLLARPYAGEAAARLLFSLSRKEALDVPANRSFVQ